jgi:hypothetical protein
MPAPGWCCWTCWSRDENVYEVDYEEVPVIGWALEAGGEVDLLISLDHVQSLGKANEEIEYAVYEKFFGPPSDTNKEQMKQRVLWEVKRDEKKQAATKKG